MLSTRIGGPASKSSLFPFGNLCSCSLGAVCETLGRPSFYSLQARPGRIRVCSPRGTGCLQMWRGASQVLSVSRLFPFAAPILQVLMLGANKGRCLCRQKQPFPFGSLDSSFSGLLCKPRCCPGSSLRRYACVANEHFPPRNRFPATLEES